MPTYKFEPTAEQRTDRRQDQREDQREDRREERREDRRENRREDRPAARFDNPNQDPNHPYNTTQPRDLNASTNVALPPEAYMTEQEKAAMAGETKGNKKGTK